MWLYFKHAALSIVENKFDVDCLLVRSRVTGDIENIFPNAKVFENTGTDYRYRAMIPRHEVAERIYHEVMGINYTNFKASLPMGRYRNYTDVYLAHSFTADDQVK